MTISPETIQRLRELLSGVSQQGPGVDFWKTSDALQLAIAAHTHMNELLDEVERLRDICNHTECQARDYAQQTLDLREQLAESQRRVAELERHSVALQQIAQGMRPRARRFAEDVLEGQDPAPWEKNK